MLLALCCYVAGAAVGAVATRGGTPQWWRHAIRVQMLVTGTTLALLAGWRLQLGDGFSQAASLAVVVYVVALFAQLTRRRSPRGEAALEAWSCGANTGFWVVPLATAMAGPAATVVAVLADQLTVPMVAVTTKLLRRDAPKPQRVVTSVFDYAGTIGLAVGLGLNLVSSPPGWTLRLLPLAGPVLAATGAAMWAGSVRHLLGRLEAPGRRDWWRYASLVAVRITGYSVVLLCWWGRPAAVVAALGALGAPTFNPPSVALLYGYRSQVAGLAARWGWVVAAAGLPVAWVVSRA